MNPEIYSEWLRRQGHSVVRTAASYWHSEGLGAYQAFPYHWLIEPSAAELRELTIRYRAVALRYSTDPASSEGASRYHAVYTGQDYDFDVLHAWARKNVRRGLRNCTVEPISVDRYLSEGWALRRDTLERQQRGRNESPEEWQRRYSTASDLPGFEFWGAQVRGRLGATLVTFQMQDWYYMISQMCHRNFLAEHVNNALSFVVTQTLIRRPNVRGIYYGMQSLDAPSSVDEFKFRMGYEARPVRQRVVFHPCLYPFVNRAGLGLLRLGVRITPGQRWLAKAEGMFSLAIEQCPAR